MLKDEYGSTVLAIFRPEVRPFTDKQIALVTNFAAQAVIAIENARLLNELRQRTDDLSETLEQQTASAKVLEVISRSAFDLHAVFETVAESSVRLCEADRAFIFQYDGELLRMKAFYNASPELADWVRNIRFALVVTWLRLVPPSIVKQFTFPMFKLILIIFMEENWWMHSARF